VIYFDEGVGAGVGVDLDVGLGADVAAGVGAGAVVELAVTVVVLASTAIGFFRAGFFRTTGFFLMTGVVNNGVRLDLPHCSWRSWRKAWTPMAPF
jgi:hypothetical protein